MIDSGLIVSILRASLIAIFPLGLWAVGRFGTSKVWYFQTSVTSMVFGLARFWYYVLPFLGLMFLFGGVGDYYLGQNPHSTSTWFYVSMACIPIGFICGFLQPDWLSPAWLRRLKQEHGTVIPLLFEDAVGMDKKTLKSKTQTWADLEAWVAEVQQKHGLER
jgi:hypothetical protein